jgi:hypothetical protein
MTESSKIKEYERKITPVERFLARSPYSIVTMAARIKGSVTEEMLRYAVSKVRQRHPNLRVRITEDGNRDPWFTSEGAGAIPVEIVPRESAKDWIKVVQASSEIPFEFETQPAIRFILVQSPTRSELIILCHHILCDGLSLAYLARDLMEHLGDPAREVDVLPDPVPIERDNIPDDVSLNAVAKFFVNRINKKWAQEKVLFDQEDYRELTEAYWKNYTHQVLPIELSQAQTSALVDRCRSEKVTVNSALSAAFLGAQSVVQGEKPYHPSIGVAGSLRDRLRRPAGEVMGFYAGVVRLKYKYGSHRGFWDNARSFHKKVWPLYTNKNLFNDVLTWSYLDPSLLEAIHFKKIGGLVPEHLSRYQKLSAFAARDDVVLSVLKRDKIETLDRIAMGTAVTNLTRLDFPSQYGALELDRLIMNPGGAFPLVNVNLVLGAVTCAGRLSLLVEFVEDNVEVGTMEEINEVAIGFLLNA